MHCTGCRSYLEEGRNWTTGVVCDRCLEEGKVHNGMSGPYSQVTAKYCVRCGECVTVGLVEHTGRCPHGRELRG